MWYKCVVCVVRVLHEPVRLSNYVRALYCDCCVLCMLRIACWLLCPVIRIGGKGGTGGQRGHRQASQAGNSNQGRAAQVMSAIGEHIKGWGWPNRIAHPLNSRIYTFGRILRSPLLAESLDLHFGANP